MLIDNRVGRTETISKSTKDDNPSSLIIPRKMENSKNDNHTLKNVTQFTPTVKFGVTVGL